jgi:hypothetical protein
MTIRWYSVVVDCRDIKAQSRWWAGALGWQIAFEADDEVAVVPPHALDQTRDIPLSERVPALVFVTVPEAFRGRSRR